MSFETKRTEALRHVLEHVLPEYEIRAARNYEEAIKKARTKTASLTLPKRMQPFWAATVMPGLKIFLVYRSTKMRNITLHTQRDEIDRILEYRFEVIKSRQLSLFK